MSDQKLEALRETLAQYEAGELTSDLFGGGAETDEDLGQDESTGAQGAKAPQRTSAGAGDEYSKARALVLRKLTGSPKSRHQLAEVLREKEFSAEVITEVLDRMEEVQLVNDAEFAHTWVRTRHELKGLGTAALRRELQEKGVGAEDIESALGQLSAEDEHSAARELIENKLRGVVVPVGNGPEDRNERDKLTRRLVSMLGRRGHSPGVAIQLVREAIEERAA